MGISKEILKFNSERITKVMIFMSLFALPWINTVHLTTFLFMGLGIVLLTRINQDFSFKWLAKQWVFVLFALYYVLQVIALFFYPTDPGNKAAIAQKASLLVMPVLFYMAILIQKNAWKIAIRGFVSGNLFAAVCCLAYAAWEYFISGRTDVFFYHTYARITGMNAIYFSLYILVSLVYVFHYSSELFKPFSHSKWLPKLAAAFLLMNLVLLSSKMMIAAGTIVFLLNIQGFLINFTQKIIAYAFLVITVIGIFAIKNPVIQRFRDINFRNYRQVFYQNDFTDFPFDGLNLRLFFWRSGIELAEKNAGWMIGLGGEHYHVAMNDKMKKYKLYLGNVTNHDTGYLNYNMHNQYMESYVQFGIIGLIILLAIIAVLTYFMFSQPSSSLRFCVFIFIAIFITESVLETQSGILLFTIILSGEWIHLHHQEEKLN